MLNGVLVEKKEMNNSEWIVCIILLMIFGK